MFKTSISLSEALSKVVMILNRRPELTSGRRKVVGDEDNKSIVETSADIIQKIFTSCLTDRTSTRYAPPAGKKIGVYIFANLTLKLLFTVSDRFRSKEGYQLNCDHSVASRGSRFSSSQIYPPADRRYLSSRHLSESLSCIILDDLTSTRTTFYGLLSPCKKHIPRHPQHSKSTATSS